MIFGFKMDLQQFINKYNAYIYAVSMIFFIICMIFLGVTLKDMNKEGAKCIQDPLAWAEMRLDLKDPASNYNCECKKNAYIDDVIKFNYTNTISK